MAAVAVAGDGTPRSSTVYVHNLEERIKIPALIEALNEIFSEYGEIVDLVAKASLKRRGQAFIVFDTPDSAERAIEEVQGFELFDKPMKLEFARSRSDATVKATGNEEEFEAHKRRRLAEKERKQAQEAQEAAKLKRPATEPADAAAKPAKLSRGAGLKSTSGAVGIVPDEYLPPNKTLFLQSLPDDVDKEALSSIFSRFEGFKEVRLVPGRKGLGFVEYEAETGAISAKESTAGMTLGAEAKPMKVTFQRQ